MYEDCTCQEIQAYRELDGVPFDFGTGMIYPSNTMGSEDAYLSMAINDHEEDDWYIDWIRSLDQCPGKQWYEDCHLCYSEVCVFAGRRKKRPNKYLRNRHYKKQLYRHICKIIPIEDCFWSNGHRKKSCGWSDYYPIFVFYDEKGERYIERYYKAGHIKWLKAYSNKKVRNTMHQYGKGNTYKKQFDLWWNYD